MLCLSGRHANDGWDKKMRSEGAKVGSARYYRKKKWVGRKQPRMRLEGTRYSRQFPFSSEVLSGGSNYITRLYGEAGYVADSASSMQRQRIGVGSFSGNE